MNTKEKLKYHCYLCQHYFTFDEMKDKRVETKVLLSNLTYAKIPHCDTCSWDKDKAQDRMIELWKDEQTLSNATKTAQKAALREFKKLKIIKKVA